MTEALPPYDIVIATRNRLHQPKASVPLMLAQIQRPERIVLVDASDDHIAVSTLMEGLCGPAGVPVHIEEAEQRNLPAQRNQALRAWFWCPTWQDIG